jgi:hypothetical protein
MESMALCPVMILPVSFIYVHWRMLMMFSPSKQASELVLPPAPAMVLAFLVITILWIWGQSTYWVFSLFCLVWLMVVVIKRMLRSLQTPPLCIVCPSTLIITLFGNFISEYPIWQLLMYFIDFMQQLVLCLVQPKAISQAKLDHDDGFIGALAWLTCLKSQSQAIRLWLFSKWYTGFWCRKCMKTTSSNLKLEAIQ